MATKHPTTLSRRAALLGGASATALAGVAAVAVAYEKPDAELFRLCDAFWRIEKERRAAYRRQTALYDAVELMHPAPNGDHYEMWVVKQDPEYCRAWRARNEALARAGAQEQEDAINEIGDRSWNAFTAINEQRATTTKGMLAKARVSLVENAISMEELEGGDPDARTLASLIRDLEKIGGAS